MAKTLHEPKQIIEACYQAIDYYNSKIVDVNSVWFKDLKKDCDQLSHSLVFVNDGEEDYLLERIKESYFIPCKTRVKLIKAFSCYAGLLSDGSYTSHYYIKDIIYKESNYGLILDKNCKAIPKVTFLRKLKSQVLRSNPKYVSLSESESNVLSKWLKG